MFVASFDRACYRYQSLNATHYPLRPPLHLPLCRLPARVLKGQFRAHEACFMCRPTYIIHAYRIRQSLSRLTHRRLRTPKPLTTAVQWWALLQPTDAVRLTPSLAKDVCSARGVTTRLVSHVRLLRVAARLQPDSPFDRATVGTYLLHFQCDETFPICSGCKRSNLECSLSTPQDPADSQANLSRLNVDDLRLLHDWNAISDTKFADHNAEESWRKQRGREIELGLQHPYGMSSRSFTTLQAYLVDTRQVGQTENIRLSFNHAEELTSLAQFCTSSWPSPPSIYIPRIQTSRSFMTRQSPTTTPRSDSLDLTLQPSVPRTVKPCSISLR